jgi:hypothetical protein
MRRSEEGGFWETAAGLVIIVAITALVWLLATAWMAMWGAGDPAGPVSTPAGRAGDQEVAIAGPRHGETTDPACRLAATRWRWGHAPS